MTDAAERTGLPLRAFLPNAITALALCFGLTGIRFGFSGEWEKALASIIVAGVLDGMDGLASVVGLSTAAMLAIVAASTGHDHATLIAIALAGGPIEPVGLAWRADQFLRIFENAVGVAIPRGI